MGIGGMARRAGAGIGRIMGWKTIADTGRWMAEGAAIASPSRFPWSKRAEWSAPPPAHGSFEGAMLRNGVDEDGLKKRHAVFAWCAAATLAGAIVCAEGLAAYALQGKIGGVMACVGMGSVMGASFLGHSFRAWQLRVRRLDAGFGEFMSKPGVWIPPVRYARENGHE